MNARYPLIALAVALLGIGAWMLVRGAAGTEAARPREVANAEVPNSIDATPQLEREPRAEVERSRTADGVQAPLARPILPSETHAPADVEGTLVIERADGSKDAAPDGHFALVAWRGDVGEFVDVEVHAGRWAAHFPDELVAQVTHVGFERVRIGARSAVVREPSTKVAIPTSHGVEVVAYFPTATILRVVDESTGRDLDQVELVEASSSPSVGDIHPGPAVDRRPFAVDKTSPIDFSALDTDPEPGIRIVRVHSPGFAWTKVTLDTRVGCERLVQLERGGALRLTVVDNSGSKGVELRFRRAPEGKECVLSMACNRSGEVMFDDFEPGAYSVSAEIGESYDALIELGHVGVVISAGMETRATLEIGPAPRVAVATAGGVVIVPPEWQLVSLPQQEVQHLSLTLKLLDAPLDGRDDWVDVDAELANTDADGRLVFKWTQPDLQVGRYEFCVDSPRASAVIDLPLGGKADYRFELASPAQLVVRVVDAVTGVDVEIDGLEWNPPMPEGVTATSLDYANFDAAKRRFIIRAPAGEIELEADAEDFVNVVERLKLSPGYQEHTMRLRRATSIDVVLHDGDTVLPFPDDWDAEVETESAEDADAWFGGGPTLRRYRVPAAGRYRFKLPAINGYEPIADQLVDAVEGKTVRLDVALTKLH